MAAVLHWKPHMGNFLRVMWAIAAIAIGAWLIPASAAAQEKDVLTYY